MTESGIIYLVEMRLAEDADRYFVVRCHELGDDWGKIEYVPVESDEGEHVVVLKYSRCMPEKYVEYRIVFENPESEVDRYLDEIVTLAGVNAAKDRDLTRYIEAIRWNCVQYLEKYKLNAESGVANGYVVCYSYGKANGELTRSQLTKMYATYKGAVERAKEIMLDESARAVFVLPLNG